MSKGIAFPVSISPNHLCGHFSPSKEDSFALKEGDLVKIDFGVQIDGYPVVLAHSVLLDDGKDSESMSLKKKAMSCAYVALETAVKSLRPEVTNEEVTQIFEDVSDAYGLDTVEGVLSHEHKRWVLDGKNVISLKKQHDNHVEKIIFEKSDIFSLDVLVSTNESDTKVKESELRTMVFMRNSDEKYDLKTKMSRRFFGEVEKNKKFAFSLNEFEDQISARAGCHECLKHGLLQPFPVLEEKTGQDIAHFKWTIAISSKRILLFTHQLPPAWLSRVKSEKPSVQKLFDEPLDSFTKSKPKQKKK